MKIYGILVLAILSLSLTTNTGNKKIAKKLVGTWSVERVDFSEMLKSMNEEDKAMAEMFMPMMEEGLKTLTWTFSKNGDFNSKSEFFGEKIDVKGSWNTSADGKLLNMIADGEKDECKLISLDKKKLVVSRDAEGVPIYFYMIKAKK